MQLAVAHISPNEHDEPEIGDIRMVNTYEEAYDVAVSMIRLCHPHKVIRLTDGSIVKRDDELRALFEVNTMICFYHEQLRHTIQVIGLD